MTIAANGLQNTLTRFNTTAARTVNTLRPDNPNAGAMASDLIALTAEKSAFQAGCAVFKAADGMRATLLDTVV